MASQRETEERKVNFSSSMSTRETVTGTEDDTGHAGRVATNNAPTVGGGGEEEEERGGRGEENEQGGGGGGECGEEEDTSNDDEQEVNKQPNSKILLSLYSF